MIRIFSYSKETKRMEMPGIAELPRHIADRGRIIWADLEDPTDEETGVLSGIFGFHVLAVEDCIRGFHLPKINPYDGYLFLIVHAVDFTLEEDVFNTLEVGIFIGENYLVTYHKKQVKGISNTLGQVAKSPGSLLRSPDWLLHGLLSTLIDNYRPVLQRLDSGIEALEAGLLDSSKEDHLHELLKLKREVFHLYRVAASQRELLQKMGHGDPSCIGEENRVYFRDLYDRTVQILQAADLYREMLSGATETAMSMVSRRMSRAVKTLAVVATLVMPLTLIAGIYGMNFRRMPGLEWEYGYVTVLVALVALVALVVFKRKRWF